MNKSSNAQRFKSSKEIKVNPSLPLPYKGREKTEIGNTVLPARREINRKRLNIL